MWQTVCGTAMAVVRVENGSGGSSPAWTSRSPHSLVPPSRRGGVPVFRRPSGKPASSKVRAKPTAGASRSEEHTSELQSLMRISYDVFCLKKKKPQDKQHQAT